MLDLEQHCLEGLTSIKRSEIPYGCEGMKSMFKDRPECHGGTWKVKHPAGDRDKISVMLTVRLRLPHFQGTMDL